MNKKNNVISIVFICDDNYAMPTGVAITSLEINRKKDYLYDIYILCHEVSEENKNKLITLNKENFNIIVKVLEHENSFSNIEQKTEHVTTTALYKFLIPEIFPKLDKILYIDCDVLIQKDLGQLYNIDINEYYVGAVPDLIPMLYYNPSGLKRLNIEHEYYFNTGVMLLNLKLMRKNNVGNLMLNYRKNGINFFMDQDAFNVILGKKLKVLQLKYNYMTHLLGRTSIWDISNFYDISTCEIGEYLIEDVCIVHLATKLKPWKYDIYYFTDLFLQYHKESSFANNSINFLEYPIKYRKLEEENLNKRTDDLIKEGLYSGLSRDKKIIVSLTTFPKRIEAVIIVIRTMLSQTLKPDKVILWLSNEEYPNKEFGLQKELMNLMNFGLEIKFTENIIGHKKYYDTMMLFPNDIVITVDDDVIYPKTLVEDLYKAHIEHPDSVIGRRSHYITYNSKGDFNQYSEWRNQNSLYHNIPLMGNVLTGVGGILYPPNCMNKELFNLDILKKIALTGDDLWLKFMQILNNTTVVSIESDADLLKYIDDTQNHRLFNTNINIDGNDKIIHNLYRHFRDYNCENNVINSRLHSLNIDKIKCFVCDNMYLIDELSDNSCPFCFSDQYIRGIVLYVLHCTKIINKINFNILTIGDDEYYSYLSKNENYNIKHFSFNIEVLENDENLNQFIHHTRSNFEKIDLIILKLNNTNLINIDILSSQFYKILKYNSFMVINIPRIYYTIEFNYFFSCIGFSIEEINFYSFFSPEEIRLSSLHLDNDDHCLLRCSKVITEGNVESPIPICYISKTSVTDDLNISIISLLENTISSKYIIYILYSQNYNQEDIDNFKYLESQYSNCQIILKEIDNQFTDNYIDICKIISNSLNNLKRCIFLKPNTIIQKNLKELYEIDLKNFSIGAVKELSSVGENIFNTSVMVIDIDKIYITKNNYEVTPIELKYNLNANYLDEEKSFNFGTKIKLNPKLKTIYKSKEIKEALIENFIFNYSDNVNPISNSECSFYSEWWKYYRLSQSKIVRRKSYNEPKISVIIPVYNVENYLQECIDSVINQTLEEIEIICINDGSTDDSLEILRKYAKFDKRIIILEQENQGAGVARNKGLDVAKGEYLSFLDPDDFFELTMLEQSYNRAIENDVDIVVYDYMKYSQKTNRFSNIRQDFPNEKEVFSYKDQKDKIFLTLHDQAWNKLFKSSFIKNNNIRFQHLFRTNDVYFTNIALAYAKKITILNKKLAYYRLGTKVNSQSTLHLYPLSFYEAELALRDKLKEIGVYEEVEQCFLNKVLNDSLDNMYRNKDIDSNKLIYNHIKENLDRDFSITNYKEYFCNPQLYDEFILVYNTPYDGYKAIKGY